MEKSRSKKAYLVLQDGTVLEGRRFGAETDSVGELVFTTGMGAYVETLTDPGYYGQIIVQTFPMAGNYGIMEEDFEGRPACCGYVVRECCDSPSNFRAQYDLDKLLRDNGIPGISGIDTRELTRRLREQGVMNAAICDSPPDRLDEIEEYAVSDAVMNVSCQEEYVIPAAGEKKYSVTLVDYGSIRSLTEKLTRRGCELRVIPAGTAAADILSADPDGVVLSNGPGDPAENTQCVRELKKMIKKVPIFGISLGHQLMALAFGGSTYKLRHGHRGANQPVSGPGGQGEPRTFITTQNHGYAVDESSLEGVGTPLFRNANDGSCEGLEYPGLNCFSVQFYPEAHGGRHDTGFLFDRFTDLMEGNRNA